MNIKLLSSLTMASACCFSNVNAETFSYTYIEAGIAEYVDEAEEVTFLIGGSINIATHFNLLADYSTTTLDSDGSVDLDFDILSLGVGYHTPINEKTDFNANIKYVTADISITSGFSSLEIEDTDGFGLGIGVRHKVSDKVEASAAIDYIDLEDASETTLTVGGRYYFNEKLSAALSYTIGEEDLDGIAGTLRYDFK